MLAALRQRHRNPFDARWRPHGHGWRAIAEPNPGEHEMKALEGKVAVIVGGTSGIGARTAEVFVEEGATVVIAGRRSDAGEALASKLGGAASFVKTDAASETELKDLIDGTAQRFGRIDCLFNNAGYGIPQRSIADLDIAEFDAQMAVIVRAVVLGMKFVAPVMLRQRSGCILNTGSIAAHRSGLSSQTYSLAKAAVVHATRCVAAELGEHNIRVNSISPGAIVTGVFAKGVGVDPNTADRHLETVTRHFANAQPIPRAGMPQDIAQAALFLASDSGSFINGVDLVVDGGVITGNRFSAGIQARRDLVAAVKAEIDSAG
ncbi:MAG TPA: glucose 1-dehydrogenase [Ramlibacter sp.]|uniref:SDR family NAD(P)-dependent oxidoreductase n=1 Tax=Ramlibacter sp. TaxID=1917967 RepID=UPI002D0573C0|nr:glucose 1-dehydrogenase [Ramlibacter sp.]HVZ45722.1 glucose 1-dehydrogenase [Ramlibacter sp.]